MKYCVRCGRPIDDSARFCPCCGARQPFSEPPAFQSPVRLPGSAFDGARAGNEAPAVIPASNCCALVPVYNRPLVPAHKKGVVAYLVWSIVLLFFCNIIGTPFAAAAALYALAADAGDYADCEKRLAKASTLCIIATVINVATLVFLILSHAFL